jgi:HSP20 family protein
MARDLSYFMQSVFLPASGPQRSDVWQPPIDVYQTRDGWLIKADLAGVNPDDVVVELHNHHIAIRGQRRDTKVEEGCCCFRMEISYSRFERTIELPDELSSACVATEFQHGMLLIRIRNSSNR